MKLFGSIIELVAAKFRKNSQQITLRPNQTTTYTADRDLQLPQVDADDILVSRTSPDTLTNKTLTSPILTTPTLTVKDNVFTVQDDSDATKQLQLQLSGITTGTTRTLTVPDASSTITVANPGVSGQSLTNTTIDGSGNTITNISLTTGVTGVLPGANGGTGIANSGKTITLGGNLTTSGANPVTLTTSGSTSVTLPTTGTLATLAGSETLDNKTLAASTVIKSGFKLEEAGGADQLTFQVQGQTGSANINIQDLGGVSQDIVLSARAATLTNKTIDGSLNTISNIGLTSQITGILPGANGGTGVNNSGKTVTLGGNLTTSGAFATTLTSTALTSVTLPTTGTLATLAGSETLSSKTLASPEVTTLLRLQNQGQLKLREGTGGGTDEVSIQAPATLAASYTLTLPPDDGTSNQVLQTDGAGILSWGNAAATPGTAGNVYSDGAALQTIAFAANANKVFGVNSAATSEEAKSLLTGTTGTDFAVAHAAGSITFNLPDASATARGVITPLAQTITGTKTLIATAAPATFIVQNTSNSTNSQIQFIGKNGSAVAQTYSVGSNINTSNSTFEVYDNTAVASRLLIAPTTGNLNVPASLRIGDSTAPANKLEIKTASRDGMQLTDGTNIHTISQRGTVLDITAQNGLSSGTINFHVDAADNSTVIMEMTATAITTNIKTAIKGTATNDTAAAGYVGEYISSAIASGTVPITTATATNVTSISLTAGDWEICGAVSYGQVGAPTFTRTIASINTTSATLNTQGDTRFDSPTGPSANSDSTVTIPGYRLSLSGTTTVYLIAFANFSGGTSANAYGRISARRVR